MGIEIERKFLVKDGSWNHAEVKGILCRQGYLSESKASGVRVRILGEEAFITVKGETVGLSRSEFEYNIPVKDAEEILKLCINEIIEKTRYFVEEKGFFWEVDVFSGSNEGLVMAEIELEAEDQPFSFPTWVGNEVSSDIRYYNVSLSRQPYTEWDGGF